MVKSMDTTNTAAAARHTARAAKLALLDASLLSAEGAEEHEAEQDWELYLAHLATEGRWDEYRVYAARAA